jgi:serine/threonine protein kinase
MLGAGSKLGPYEVVGQLGTGGMGEVYRARDTRLERTVAIKILPAQFSSDPARKQRFEREAKTISSLNHPHICVLHDIGHQDGIDYLVMECVEGETLAKRLEKGPLPLEQVLKYGAQVADALDKAHRSGTALRVHHRRVKDDGQLAEAMQDSDCRDAIHRGLLDCRLRYSRRSWLGSVLGECSRHEEPSGA